MSANNKSQLSSPLSVLTDGNWWKEALSDSLLFLPYCIFPALLLALANIALVVCMNTLSDTSSLESITLEALTQKVAIGLITSLLGISLTIWSLTIWLDRLTAFCHLRFSQDTQDRKTQVKSALAAIKQNKKTLFKFWFTFSLYLLIPISPLTILLSVQTLAASPSLKALNMVAIPPELALINNCGIGVFTVVTLAMTMAATAVASKLSSSAQAMAAQSVKLFLNRALALCLIAAVVLVVNAIISAPLVLFTGGQMATQSDLLTGILTQVWLCITSSILWTLSLCPAVEYLRRDLVSA